jgi:ATP-dependent exoDNAse (exonuclease V) alpha subunit
MEKFCRYRQENHIKFKTFIKTIVIEKKIDGTIWVTTAYLLGVEKDMTDLMMELFYKDSYDIPEDKINQLICIYEERKRKSEAKFKSFSLEPEQKTSVIKSIQNRLSIITGPPGTGKTEILKCKNYCLYELYKIENPNENIDTTSIIDNSEDDEDEEDEDEDDEDDNSEVYSEYNDDFSVTSDICIECDESNKYINPRNISLMAPTGLAFINMNRSQEAKHYNNKISGTCHRLLYHTIPNIIKHKNPKYCDCKDKKDCKYNMDIKLIELDEASMLDTFVLYDLLKACKYFNSRLILLGDVEQLPSIGPGKILQQLIESQVFTVTKLIKIKRQNSGALVNNILKMSKEIVQVTDFVDDTMVLLNIDDFMVNNELNNDEFERLINENNLNKDDTKFITGFNTEKKIFNTKTINNLIQNKFNPEDLDNEYDKIPSNYKYENGFTFRIKDKIIRTENDYSSEKMRANGEEAEIIDFDGLNVTIKYSGVNDKPERIGINGLYENFTLNYCVTVHKSQGSQYKNVVFFIEPEQKTFITKKMIYTAISRAQTRCFVISRPNDFISLQKQSTKIDFKVSLFMKESDNYEFRN